MQRSCLVAHGVELAEDLLDELGRRIVFRIQVLDGITHTLT
jgi:hypothetical protein